MDLTDRKILDELRANCRVSYESLARKLGVTANSIKRRVLKLENLSVIEDYIIVLSHAMVDADPILGLVNPAGSREIDDLMKEIGNYTNVSAVGLDSNGWLVLRVDHVGAQDLLDIGEFLRGIEGVAQVRLHPFPTDRGNKIELTKLQLRVLKELRDDPRMPISTIASRSGLTTKRIRRALQELFDSQAVWFTASININAGPAVRFVLRIVWDNKVTKSREIIEWLQNEFPIMYSTSHVSTAESLIFAVFTSEHIRDAEIIARRLKELPSVRHELTVIPYGMTRFTGLRDKRLQEMFDEAGLTS
ncbi:MAG: Lrp/AsnC family transcriptional regulator [Candidatus Thorarchaeota archaeon]